MVLQWCERLLISLITIFLFNDKLTNTQQFGGVNNLNQQPTEFQPSSLDFLNSVRAQPVGSAANALGQPFRVTGENLRTVNWHAIDRRAEEGWWHLYPFGERFFDIDLDQSRPWKDQQIDLDFFFPYYGFRFNYTFLFPEGFIAFSHPHYIQPPYTFPNPKWPITPDPSLVAAFMSPQQFMFVGDTPISHVWHRIVSRPTSLIGQHVNIYGPNFGVQTEMNTAISLGSSLRLPNGENQMPNRNYAGQTLKTQNGRLEDPELLNLITRDIRESMVGARGFTADYAIVITWERMGYGGAPKITQLHRYEEVKRWQNTYQMVVATDEIRSYVMFNFANINWTSSTSAGGLNGRGGKQSALVGFNGGNGTGWFEFPYSAEGNSYKLVQFGATEVAGRWIARVDEEIQYGGCTNDSNGNVQVSDNYGSMLGGFSLNISGPCFRPTDVIKINLDELTVDCERLSMVMARCVIPVNKIYRIGMVELKMSTDGGMNYAWWNFFYVLTPHHSVSQVNLLNDPLDPRNNWRDPYSKQLKLNWAAANISASPSSRVDVVLYGYWEDVEGHMLTEIANIAEGIANTGTYEFNPYTMIRRELVPEAWQSYMGGVVQVRVTEHWMSDRGDGIYWSSPTPFGWFYRPKWEYEYGANWALDICIDWFEYDGRRENYVMELEPKVPCPCRLDQALMDIGRFTPLPDCDMVGNHECYYTHGAKHCVMSTISVWTGAGQMCCYDIDGFLMFSDDYEYNDYYLRYYSAGVTYRAHPWGSAPYKLPPYIPTMSNFYNDLLPYEYCCRWAAHCEFYFWRRQSSGCQMYMPPSVAFAYGEPHFITFDGARYTFSGKGYYVLTTMKSPSHDLMIQARFEQPPRTLWDSTVRATVITGVAAQDNDSAVVQIFSRKEFRQWRYKTDIYVDGIRIFFDTSYKKTQMFKGVTIRSQPRNMNQSEIEVMFTTGVGLLVTEDPYWMREYHKKMTLGSNVNNVLPSGKCGMYYRTMGLLGTYNNDREDELTTPECSEIRIGLDPTPSELQTVYNSFGERWRVDNIRYKQLFQIDYAPINDPLSFSDLNYRPVFDPWQPTNSTYFENLIFNREQVRVECRNVRSCEYDYLVTGRREIALDTLEAEKKFEGLKQKGEVILTSCGPLEKGIGVVKRPLGDNYLDGVTVTFTCKPDYYLHGEQQRTCINGTWTPGWWAWCRTRRLEMFLKWLTGILTTIGIIAVIIGIFFCCWVRRKTMTSKYSDSRYASTQQIIPATSPNAQRPASRPSPPSIIKQPLSSPIHNSFPMNSSASPGLQNAGFGFARQPNGDSSGSSQPAAVLNGEPMKRSTPTTFAVTSA